MSAAAGPGAVPRSVSDPRRRRVLSDPAPSRAGSAPGATGRRLSGERRVADGVAGVNQARRSGERRGDLPESE